MDLKELVAREAIRDCLARLARGEDRRDAALLRACYWPDAQLDFRIFAGDFAAYLAWVVPGSSAVLLTLHTLGQSLIRINGDHATAETHVTSYHRVDAGAQHRDMTIAGRYLDRFEYRDRDWRVARRTLIYDWARDDGVSADWTQGLMGAPFLSADPTGKTRDDASEQLFTPIG